MPDLSTTSFRRLALTALLGAAMALSACGDDVPPGADTQATAPAIPPAATEPGDPVPTSPASTTDTPATSPGDTAPATETPPADATTPSTSPAEQAPGSPADAPSPDGVRPDTASRSGKRPRSLSQRITADSTAKLNVRTMVSIVEGCHSGRDTYKACNSHDELGSKTLLGITIGKRRGEVQISATDNGFRITGHSMSGAKFTVARGPGGDRFKCISGPMPGACPPDRTWSW